MFPVSDGFSSFFSVSALGYYIMFVLFCSLFSMLLVLLVQYRLEAVMGGHLGLILD